ncbi:MAG: glycerate kinase [Nitrospinota bacterium]|nr:MAG: glycerate kinase [Nitrospinota bacterium]
MGEVETRLREQARQIFAAALQAVDPKEAVRRYLHRQGDDLVVEGKRYHLPEYAGVYVVGAGKAGAAMGVAVEEIVGEWLCGGIVTVKYGHTDRVQKITLVEAGHPVPDEAGVSGARQMVELLQARGERDLVICLISGGGSALLPAPVPQITLSEKQEVTRLLLRCGANINEINAVRKHISQVKGGQLARLAAPATLLTLILSDVIGDPLDVIASGPTVPDQSTFQDCFRIFEKYQILDEVPPSIRAYLQQGVEGKIPETPKAGDPVFAKTQNVIIGSNILAVKAAAAQAEILGLRPLILSTFVEGETREIARMHAAMAKEVLHSGHPIPPPACLISGGETTVTIRGDGLGGRNQEFVLAAALDIAGWPNVVILSGGTDGTDGPTDAAGAIADGETVRRAEHLGLDPLHFLQRNDSYHFFSPLGDLLITGPTNTNVMDVRLVLIGKESTPPP